MTDAGLKNETIGRYRLRSRLGHGGMGTVYLARASGAAGFEKWVALKVVHPHLTHEKRFLHMFLDEARLSARLSHPNICTVFDFGEAGGDYYMAMEYLDGESLSSVIRHGGNIPLELMARIVADAARGLHAVHEATDDQGVPLEVVHRDVSPQNIFVLNEGVTKVMDFGIAKARARLTHTATGHVKGKLAYMAPEQLDEQPVDRRCDVFALGIVLWEGTVGRRLFGRRNELLTMAAALKEPIPAPSLERPDYPAALERVVMRALQRDVDRRYPDMAQFADELDESILSMGKPAGAPQLAQWMKSEFADNIVERTALLREDSASGSSGVPMLDDTDPDGNETISGDQVSLVTDATDPVATDALSPGAFGDEAVTATTLAATIKHTSPGEQKRARGRPVLLLLALALTGGVLMVSAWTILWCGDEVDGPTVAHQSDPALGLIHSDGVQPTPPAPTSSFSAPSQPTAPAPPAPPPTAAPLTPDAALPDAAAEDDTEWVGRRIKAKTGSRPKTRTKRPAPPKVSGPPGLINILSVPPAQVYLGSRRLGTTPLQRVSLPPGRHVLKLRALQGGAEKRVAVTIRSGKASYVSVKLDR